VSSTWHRPLLAAAVQGGPDASKHVIVVPLRSFLDLKFKITKLFHQIYAAHALSIKLDEIKKR